MPGVAAYSMFPAQAQRLTRSSKRPAVSNAVTEYQGYKPLTAEGAVTASPEIILIASRGLESIGGIDRLLAFPGLAETPAGRARRVVAIDDLKLLGFGPRTGEAVTELATEFGK